MRAPRRSVLYALFAFFTSFCAQAQMPAFEWQYTKNHSEIDKIVHVTPTADGGYLLVISSTTPYGEVIGGSDVFLTKINSAGAQVWTRDASTTSIIPYGYENFPTFKPLELQNGNILMRGSWYQYLYINGTTGATISTTTFDDTYQPDVVGFAQLANGTIGIFGSIYVTTQSQYKLRIYNSAMSSYTDKIFGGTGNETASSLTTSLDGTHFVMAGYSDSPAGGLKSDPQVGGWVLSVDASGTKIFDYSTPNTIDRILPFMSKRGTHMVDFTPTNILKNGKIVTGKADRISDYLLVGTKAGKPWLAAGDIFQFMDIETTIPTATYLRSVSTTYDGRVLVSWKDSVAMLNGKFDRIWKTTSYKDLGVEIMPNQSLIVFGELDTRFRKSAPYIMTGGDAFQTTGMFRTSEWMNLDLKYKNGTFVDLDNNGVLDFYAVANHQYYWSADATNYSNLYLASYLSNSGSTYSITSKDIKSYSQWDNMPPNNWTFHDFDRDNDVDVFYNDFNTTVTAREAMKTVNPANGAIAPQTISGLPKAYIQKFDNLQWADFNNDGMLDAFLPGDAIYKQTAANTFAADLTTTTFSGDIGSAIALDINNDGYVDIIDKTNKAIWLNSATMTFTKHGVNFTHTPVYPVELNGDGFIDFIGNNGNTWYTFINNGSMTFTYTALNLANPMPIGDINNDGHNDIVAAQTTTGTNPAYYVYFNNGSGAFATTINYDYMVPASYGWKPTVVPGNYDADGDLDLALVDDHQVLFMKNGQATSNAAPSVPSSPTFARTGNNVTLSWTASTDDKTSAASLNYNVYIKNGSTVVVNSLSNISNGKRLVVSPGNAGLAKTYKITLPTGTYQWGVQAIDKGLANSAFTAEQQFFVTNNPTNIAITNATIAENSTANIGTFSSTDSDVGETYTYTLVTGTGDTDNALFKITGAILSAQGTGLNFETKSSYSIRIRTTDNRQGFFEKQFTITATNVVELASLITLTPSTFAENQAVGTTIGTLGTNDQDAGDTFTYTLVAGTGDTDNALVEIAAASLKSKQSFNFETKPSLSIRVQVKDQSNNIFAMPLTVTITDVNDLTKPVFSIPIAAITQTGFTINWTAVEGATSYDVEVATGDPSALVSGFPKSVSATTLDVTGLTQGTTYAVKMRSAKSADKSPYSDVVNQITKPGTPLALDPPQVGTDGFTASWNEVPSATSYELEVAEVVTGSDVFTPMSAFVPAKIVTGGHDFSVLGLQAGKSYKYRVRAVNAAGVSPNSNEKSVTTTTGGNGLKIETAATTATANAGESTYPVSIVVTGGKTAKTVKLKVRGIITGDFITLENPTVTGTNFQFSIAATLLDELGVEYYATATDGDATVEQPTHSFIYRANTETSAPAIPFASGFDGTSGTYQMFSVPYELVDNDIDKMFDGPLNGPDKTQWRLFHYFDQNTLQEYPTTLKEIKPGEGYWFNTIISPVQIKPKASKVVQVTRTTGFPLQLKKGWNQIGNPYPFDIDWAAAIAGNSNIGSLNTFSNGSYSKPAKFKAWAGAFVHAAEATTINIPISSKSVGRVAAAPGSDIDEEAWQLPLYVSAPGVGQESGIGMNPEASLSKDRFDDITVPRFFNYIELNTRHDEFFAHSFSTDVVPTANVHEWLFTVKSNIDKDKEISWDNTQLRNAESSLILIDMQDRTWVDMKTTNHYSFNGNGNRDIKIIYTRDGEINPGMTLLGQSYPNPFNDHVTIPVLAEKAGLVITVDVIDMLGRRVKTITMTTDKAGPQVVEWNGHDDADSKISSGMYFYRISGDGASVNIKRMIKN